MIHWEWGIVSSPWVLITAKRSRSPAFWLLDFFVKKPRLKKVFL
jgi:hypothetical protein